MTPHDRRMPSRGASVTVVAFAVLTAAAPLSATTFGSPVKTSSPPGAVPGVSYSGPSEVTIGRAVPQIFVVENTGDSAFTGEMRITLPESLRIDRRRAASPVVRRALARYREHRAAYREERSGQNRRRLVGALRHARLLRTGASVPVRASTSPRRIPGPHLQGLITRPLRVAPGTERSITVRLRGVRRVGEAEFRLAITPPGKADEYWSQVNATLDVTTGSRILPNG